MPFVKGQSGNPAGRPVGSRNKVNRAMDPVFTANGEAIIERVVEHAKAANPVAMRLCMDRLVPMGKHRPLGFQLPPMTTSADVPVAIATVHDALGDGDISIAESAELLRVAQLSARILREVDADARDLTDRLERVEEALTKCLILLGAAPDPGAKSESPTAPRPSDPASGEGAIVNNNAETVAPASAAPASAAVASAEPAPVAGNNEDPIVAAALDRAVEAALADVRPRRSTRDRLMDSVSPLALMVGLTPPKSTPVMLPDLPLASAA